VTVLVQDMSFGKLKYWLLIVDNAMDYCWSFFLKSKDKTSKTMIGLTKDLMDIEKKSIKYICCDNTFLGNDPKTPWY